MNQRDTQEILKLKFMHIFSIAQPKISSFRSPPCKFPSKTISQTENDYLKLAES